jgi:hypothetical protein
MCVRPGFPVEIDGDFVRQGSVTLANISGDSRPEIIVGGTDGRVHAYSSSGAELWVYDTGTAAIEGKPAVGDVDADGFAEIVVGVGSTFPPASSLDGAVYVISHTGTLQCTLPNNTGGLEGVFSSPALADLDGNDGGRLEIVYGSWDQRVRSINHDCTLSWERQTFDTVWSSPAIGDINRDGFLDVVIGTDSHFEPPPIGTGNGGRLLVFDGRNGNDLPGFPIQVNEVIHSSPALGDLDGDGALDIVVGTGNCYGSGNINCGNPQTPGAGEFVAAWNRFGSPLPGWPVAIPGRYPIGSPALADLDGNGTLEVVVNAVQRNTGPPETGWVYVFNANGTIRSGWPKSPVTPADCNSNTVSWATAASPIVADLVGDAQLEIAVPSNSEVVVWNASGTQLSRQTFDPPGCQPPAGTLNIATPGALSGTPAIGDLDGLGSLSLVAAGYDAFNVQNPGAIHAWDFSKTGSPSAPWPTFRRSSDNNAINAPPPLFADGFESGNTSAWSSTVP